MDTERVDRGRMLLTDRRCCRRAALRAGAAGLAATTLAVAGRRAGRGQFATPASSPAATGDVARLVDVGGRKLYLECHGSGGPTVMLEAGYRASGRYWTDDLLHPDAPRTMVMPGVAEFTASALTTDREPMRRSARMTSSAAAIPSPSPARPRRSSPTSTRCCRRRRFPVPTCWRATPWAASSPDSTPAPTPTRSSAWSSSTPTASSWRT